MQEVPADLIVVGRVIDAYGLKGGIKVQPYSQDARALLETRAWWFGEAPAWRDVDVYSARMHGQTVIAQLVGVADRDAALALKGQPISVSRARFPRLDEEEFYWVDLIGLAVANPAGVALGEIIGVSEHAAHPILEVRRPGETAEDAPLLIPFVKAVIGSVSLTERRVVADWQLDY